MKILLSIWITVMPATGASFHLSKWLFQEMQQTTRMRSLILGYKNSRLSAPIKKISGINLNDQHAMNLLKKQKADSKRLSLIPKQNKKHIRSTLQDHKIKEILRPSLNLNINSFLSILKWSRAMDIKVKLAGANHLRQNQNSSLSLSIFNLKSQKLMSLKNQPKLRSSQLSRK